VNFYGANSSAAESARGAFHGAVRLGIIAGSRNERASYNGSIEASQASDVGSIPIARSKNPDDSIAFLPGSCSKSPHELRVLFQGCSNAPAIVLNRLPASLNADGRNKADQPRLSRGTRPAQPERTGAQLSDHHQRSRAGDVAGEGDLSQLGHCL
jgi:hypothetical protein